jgi:zinc transport system substrate-binding protein
LTYLSQEIGGDHVQVTQLVPSNTEIHSWEPSASHIAAVENADIVFYNGAGLDHWMQDDVLTILSTAKTRIIVDSTNGLELLMSEDHEHESTTNQEEHDHGLFDPHTWVSPYMAKLQAQKIYEALLQADPEHEQYYAQRWQNLEAKLKQIDNDYSSGLANTKKSTIIVSHEAFGYLAHRYSFEQHGVIGLSADEQPSAATIAGLVEEMTEHEIYVVFVDPVYSTEYAQTIKSEVQAQTEQNVSVLTLYLMLGPSDNMDLLTQMQNNLANLKIGLVAD